MSNTIINNLINACSALIPQYAGIEADYIKANGNVALCIIDADGMVYGKIFGDDKIKGRESFNTAWLKASQVHITGIKTGHYEKLVFTDEIDDKKFGIKRCDLIGFKGGVPLSFNDGTTISIGFSGFRGITDIELIERAYKAVTAL